MVKLILQVKLRFEHTRYFIMVTNAEDSNLGNYTLHIDFKKQ